MDEQLISEGSGGWDEARLERALFASGQRTPRLSKERRADMLQALLAETARLEAAATQNAASTALPLRLAFAQNDERLDRALAQSGERIGPMPEKRRELVLQTLFAENARLAAATQTASHTQTSTQAQTNEQISPAFALDSEAVGDWDETRIERALFASGQRIAPLKDSRKAEMLQALLAETNRLSVQAEKTAPRKSTIWDALREILFTRRVVGALGGTLAAVVLMFGYYLVGGARPAATASAQGSFQLAETRQGPLGIQWALPRTYANANGFGVSPGDEMIATTPVTLTFDNGAKTVVAAVGSQLRVLPDKGVEIVKGEMRADATANTTGDQFKVQSASATVVTTNANFRVKVNTDGTLGIYPDAGKVTAATSKGLTEIKAGEEASIATDGKTEKGLQAPVVVGIKTDDGAVAFTARAASNTTVVVVDTITQKPLAAFKTDENGIVKGSVVPPPGTTAASISFRTDGADGQQSKAAAVVSDGSPSITVEPTSDNNIKPSPVTTPEAYSIPALSLPALAPVPAISKRGTPVTFEVSAKDAVDGNIPATCDTKSGSAFSVGATTVVCTATNSQGRTASGTFTINVVDTIPPTLLIPSDRTVSTLTANGIVITFNVSANDDIDGAITPTCSLRSGALFSIGTTSVDCSATDGSGNTKKGSFIVIVRDGAQPVLQLPEGMTVSATSKDGTEVNFSASANDAVDGPIASTTCTPKSGTVFPLGPTTVTCQASDKSNNTATSTFVVTVRDQTPPNIDLPGDPLVIQATSASGATANFNTSANDAVDGAVAVSCTPRPGTTFALGSTTVTCRASDSSGNPATHSFTVNVIDTIAPIFSLPISQTSSATSASGATVSFSASANDAVDGAVSPVCTPRSGSVFVIGTTSVTCRASDSRGNQRSDSFNVVVHDTTAPVISVPTDGITSEATSSTGTAVPFAVSARDLVDGPVSPTCSNASGATFTLGKTMVRCTAVDKAGNTASESFLITVVDTKPPALKLPDAISAKATSKTGAPVSFSASATDIVDGAITPICTSRSGAQFSIGVTPVTCKASDSAGNSATDTFKVTVLDTTPPVLTMPSDQTVEAVGPTGAPVPFSVTASDAIDNNLTPVCDYKPGATFSLGTTTVTCKATNDSGKIATGSFRINVVDTTAPSVVMPSALTAEATSKNGSVVNFTSSVTDKVDGKIDPVCTARSGATFQLGTTSVTCRATDKAGNKAESSFTITVRDTTAPVFGAFAPAPVVASSTAGAVVNFAPTASDVVDGALAPVCTPASGTQFSVGSTPVTCRVSDAAGNSASSTFNVIVTAQPTPTPTSTPSPTPTPTVPPTTVPPTTVPPTTVPPTTVPPTTVPPTTVPPTTVPPTAVPPSLTPPPTATPSPTPTPEPTASTPTPAATPAGNAPGDQANPSGGAGSGASGNTPAQP